MGNDNNILNNYKEGFGDYYIYIKEINNPEFSSETKIHEGYLVNYIHYIGFKDLINELYKLKGSIDDDNQLNNLIESRKLTTVSLDIAKCSILNGYSFIIINKKLYNLICKQNTKEHHKIKYKIIPESPGFIILNPDKNNKIQYKNNKNNIIDASTVIVHKDNKHSQNNNLLRYSIGKMEKWRVIYGDALNYYNNEKFFINKLIKNEIIIFQGYLIDKEWIDIWKMYSFYDQIKQNILLAKINDETIIKKLVIDEQIKANLNYDELYINMENNILINENQILQMISTNKSYALVDTNFLKNFSNNPNIKPINFF